MLSDCVCVLDARSNRIYYGLVDKGILIKQGVDSIDVVKKELLAHSNYVGECGIIGKEEKEMDLCEAFLVLKNKWEIVNNIHSLQPTYLKDSVEYLVK